MTFDKWETVKLGEIATVTKLAGFEFTKHINYTDNGEIIAIRALNVRNGYFDLTDVKRIDKETSDTLLRSKLFKNDIVLTYTGANFGEVAIVKENDRFHLAPNVAKVTIKEGLDPYFYYSYFRSVNFKSQLRSYGVGSSQPTIPMKIIRELNVPMPSLEIQKAISLVILNLDEKIQINEAINKNLEEMAQALFKRWFVDFEFANENGEPYKSSGGEFEESELGLIPKGWKLDCLDGVADYLNGLAMQKYRPEGEQFIPVIKIRELNQGRTSSDSDKASPNIDKKYVVSNGDVLFSWSGTLDIKLWCGGTGGLNQHLFKVTSKNYDKWFYYYWTKHHIERFRRIASDKATTMGHIKRSDLKEAKVLIPDPNNYRKATDIFKPIVDKMIQLSVESFYLERVRDTLLPKLMSGEIRVPVERNHNVPELPMVAESSAIYQP